MATHADFVFEGCDGGAVLGFEEPEVEFKSVFVERFCQELVFVPKLGDTRFQIGFPCFERVQEVLEFVALLGVCFFGVGELRRQLFELLHEIQLSILKSHDGLFGGLNFMGERRVFFILAGLELLLSVAGDRISLAACLDLERSFLYFDFLGADPCALELSSGLRDLLFARSCAPRADVKVPIGSFEGAGRGPEG